MCVLERRGEADSGPDCWLNHCNYILDGVSMCLGVLFFFFLAAVATHTLVLGEKLVPTPATGVFYHIVLIHTG